MLQQKSGGLLPLTCDLQRIHFGIKLSKHWTVDDICDILTDQSNKNLSDVMGGNTYL